MEEALKRMAFKPNLKEIDAQSTLRKRISARLRNNNLTKNLVKMTSVPTGPTAIEIGPYMSRTRNFLLYFGVTVLAFGVYSNIVVTGTRKETFKRNYALID